MATISIVCTVGTSSPSTGVPLSPTIAGVAGPGAFPDDTDVDTAVGVLVADGATPTQAHVNDLDTAWTTFQAAEATYQAGVISGNVVLQFDNAVVTTKRQMRAAIATLLQAVESGYGGLGV